MEFKNFLILLITINILTMLATSTVGGTTSEALITNLEDSFGNFYQNSDSDERITADTITATEHMNTLSGTTEDPSGEGFVFTNTDVTGGISLLDSLVNLLGIAQLLFTITLGGLLMLPDIWGIYATSTFPTAIRLFMIPFIMIWILINIQGVLMFWQVLRTGRA